MDKRTTCSIEGCARAKLARGWCRAHYNRWKRHGDPLGGAAERSAGRVCEVPGCGGKHEGRGYCAPHYNRYMAHGDPLWEKPARAIPDCSVEGCENPSRKRSWCASHYSQWTREGAVRPFHYKWHRGETCVVCERETGGTDGLRKFCSWNCAQAYKTYGGNVPLTFECEQCGMVTDRRPSEGGRWVRGDRALCSACRRPRNPITTAELAERDGDRCGICSRRVDMALAYPDMGSPPVDHTLPLAAGGENVPENCALAHLGCNIKKGARVDWTISA